MNMMAPKIPNQKLEQYEQNQGEFEAQLFAFDDVQGTTLTHIGFGASPDGSRIGFELLLNDGTRFRGSLPVEEVSEIMLPLIYLAIERCMLRAARTEGVIPN
jgi:hypothetical protein